METSIWAPVIQGGFAVFAVILLVSLIWLVRITLKDRQRSSEQLVEVLTDTNKVIAGNTEALQSVSNVSNDVKQLMGAVHDELLRRPCMAELENARKRRKTGDS